MHRARHALAATLVCTACLGPSMAEAQTTKPPELKSVLAGKKFTPPIKGQADVDYIKPVTKREKGLVVTRITVKNTSNSPIPRLTIDETWFDKSNQIIPGGKGFINGLLQPGEVKTIEIQTPYNAKMNANSWTFTHANGSVKPHLVKSFDEAKTEAGAKPAAKAPAKKKS